MLEIVRNVIFWQPSRVFFRRSDGRVGGAGALARPALSRGQTLASPVDKIPAAPGGPRSPRSPRSPLSPATIILACVRHTDLGSMQSLREKNFTFLKFSFGLSVQNFLVNKSYEWTQMRKQLLEDM